MRLVIIDNMNYEKYNRIRNALFESIPFVIINAEFCNDNGYFFFWDESYIPDVLLKPLQISGNKAKVNDCNRELIKILEE